ncbi:uncharacterized protein si:dkey-237j10.2 [Centropristis striata]|uniref:uncharacterized protein si:dkey-237j10.2 n=1 Tax=Centropristis striata TaxID=184440 RepID=UPI0027DFA6A6|nr:uncharacterized protein si:dkey-237j10.2 [Centropristis striata]
MLAEGFLRVLRYREERKFATASKIKRSKAHAHCTDQSSCFLSDSNSPEIQTDSADAGPNQEELNSTEVKGLKVSPQGPAGLLIPGCPPVLPLDLDDCSLLDQYPDLQVADSGRISNNLLRAIAPQHLYTTKPPAPEACRNPDWVPQHGETIPSIPDQGYLVMGDSVNISLDLPGSGLEPMSNSVLNGLLDKKLEEVYMQHLTDLARCNSHLGNSLLHGLVPPVPSSQPQEPDYLGSIVEQGSGGDSNKKISYLSTQNLVPYSSHFSSPVLRISDADTIYPQ